MPGPIYLDHNATTPAFAEVVDAMRDAWARPYLNPASQHGLGRRARGVLEDARERIADILGAKTTGPNPDRLLFTSGGTESNNLALRGLHRPARTVGTAHQNAARSSIPVGSAHPTNHLVISAIEHPSITSVAAHMAKNGYDVDYLGVDANGVLRAGDLPGIIRPETSLVAAMLVNNETGVIQPVAELAAICAEHNVPLHTDASQAAGKMPISFREIGAATMTIAAHKFGGPIGMGALIIRHDVELAPQLLGGFQQAGLRPGTENIPLALGMQTALELWQTQRGDWLRHLKTIRDTFEHHLSQIELPGRAPSNEAKKPPNPTIIAQSADRLPTTSNIAFAGLDRQQLFLALDLAGIACSTGSACASGSSEPSPVLAAMGCQPAIVASALRFSFGVSTTVDEAFEAARRITQICNDLGHPKRP